MTANGNDEESAVVAAQRLLEERATQLARNAAAAPQAGIDVMLFRLGSEQFAVEMSVLRATQPSRGLTPIPSTPPHVAGVLNVRGEIVTVLDLASVLGVARDSTDEDTYVLLAEGPEGQVGLLVDEVMGTHQLVSSDVSTTLSMSGYASGIGETRFSLLHLSQIFSRAQLVVDDDAAPGSSEDTSA
jgi:purine-binding chemotaxis protein CheW